MFEFLNRFKAPGWSRTNRCYFPYCWNWGIWMNSKRIVSENLTVLRSTMRMAVTVWCFGIWTCPIFSFFSHPLQTDTWGSSLFLDSWLEFDSLIEPVCPLAVKLIFPDSQESDQKRRNWGSAIGHWSWKRIFNTVWPLSGMLFWFMFSWINGKSSNFYEPVFTQS